MTRVAAIDLGTHTTRLLVADVQDGRLAEVARRLAITRLGQDVDRRRCLLPAAIARVRGCLVDYRRELESLGVERTLAVATSAVRDADNGEAFLGEVEWGYGFETRLLSGREEAELTFRGVISDRSDGDGGSTATWSPVTPWSARSPALPRSRWRSGGRFLASSPDARR